MVKTVILDGSELTVSGPDGDNAEIHNFGTDTVYASKFPNISADADNVIAVSAGAIDGLTGTGGKVYLKGTGRVQVNFTDEKITKTSATVQSVGSGGGSGVSAEYVDAKNAETLASANEYSDKKAAEALVSAKDYADALGSELSGYIGYTEDDIYGLEADFENSVFTRLAGAVGKTAGADFDSVRAYGGRRRCNLSDSGEVLAYYGDENFKADGSNGQVMVEQPKFYYKVVPLKTEKIDGADGYHLRKARYYISDTPKTGFKVHPAFVRNGVEVDRIYLSAFEGCIYDTSAETYLLEDEQIADFDNDKLSSIADAKPCSGLTQAFTRANARKLANNRGDGWELEYAATISATQLIFIIEYACFNSQQVLGAGNVYVHDDRVSNMSSVTGKTSDLGNISGIVSEETNMQSISYRGQENLWGNIWTWVDGINVLNPNASAEIQYGHLYVANNNFSDNVGTNTYHDTGIRPIIGTGYISAFGYSPEFDWVFVPTECIGNNKLPIGDNYWNSGIGWRTAMIGGYWVGDQAAGLFYWGMYNSSNGRHQGFGARIVYVPG